MATFKPCTAALAANLAGDCSNPRVKGYEQLGLIFNREDVDWSAITYDTDNARIVKTFKLKEAKKGFVIYNQRNNPLPFDGTQTAYNSDEDAYDKTVQFYFEGIGGGVALSAVEPLKGGDYVVLLQRKDHRGDGSFQFIGLSGGLKATAQVQDEATGYWLMTMTCQEPTAETSFLSTDYATTKTAFDALVP